MICDDKSNDRRLTVRVAPGLAQHFLSGRSMDRSDIGFGELSVGDLVVPICLFMALCSSQFVCDCVFFTKLFNPKPMEDTIKCCQNMYLIKTCHSFNLPNPKNVVMFPAASFRWHGLPQTDWQATCWDVHLLRSTQTFLIILQEEVNQLRWSPSYPAYLGLFQHTCLHQLTAPTGAFNEWNDKYGSCEANMLDDNVEVQFGYRGEKNSSSNRYQDSWHKLFYVGNHWCILIQLGISS